VFEAGEDRGREVLPTASEKELARDVAPVEHRVSATHPVPAQANWVEVVGGAPGSCGPVAPPVSSTGHPCPVIPCVRDPRVTYSRG
jgi:hypothetical protein